VRALCALLAWSFCVAPVEAQRESRDITPLLQSAEAWNGNEARLGWARTLAQGARLYRVQAYPARVFDCDVQSVTGCFEGDRLVSLSIVFLDSGAWFGFVPDDQAKGVESSRGPEFSRLYRQIADSVKAELEKLGGKGREVSLGATPWLREKAQIYEHAGLAFRLTSIPDQLVKLSVFRDANGAQSVLADFRRTPDKQAQGRLFAAQVRRTSSGDTVIDGIPVFPQGDRAYCGVSALAMAMRFCGLTFDTEELAAGAGIKFGSTRKSHIREVYEAAATEAGLSMSRTDRFDFARARPSIDAGFPVIVFRRWSQERDYVHTMFAKRYAEDPKAELPRPDANDQKQWPTRDSYAHASIVNGYNAQRREVIFTESWSEMARDRRMRFEELERTSYLSYYPRL